MFLIGLYDSPTRASLGNSSGVFLALNRLVAMSKRLFPPLASVKYLHLANRFSGPVSCAADDLELTFAGDQIEFTSGHGYHTHPGDGPGMSSGPYFRPHDLDKTGGFQPEYEKWSLWQGQMGPMAPPQGSHAGQSREPHHSTLRYPGFDFDIDSVTGYFDDFAPRHTDVADGSMCGLLVESYVSPLDDEFFRRVSSSPDSYDAGGSRGSYSAPPPRDAPGACDRKRKLQELPLSSVLMSVPSFDEVDVLFNQILVKNQPDFSYVPQNQRPYLEHVSAQAGSAVHIDHMARPTTVAVAPVAAASYTADMGMSAHKKLKKERKEPFQCPQCSATFNVKGYLTRHLKKHNVAKAFVCPFYREQSADDTGARCHPSGGFSRRDTFKTHLKAIHFIYPPGTKSLERRTRGGRCAGCFQQFPNNKEWLSDHIEAGQCHAATGRVTVKEELKEEWVD